MSMLFDRNRILESSALFVSKSDEGGVRIESFAVNLASQSLSNNLEKVNEKIKMIGDVIRSNVGLQSTEETDRKIFGILKCNNVYFQIFPYHLSAPGSVDLMKSFHLP